VSMTQSILSTSINSICLQSGASPKETIKLLLYQL